MLYDHCHTVWRAPGEAVSIATPRPRSRLGGDARWAHGEAARSENFRVTHPGYVVILEYYPPTIYHGKGAARSGRYVPDYGMYVQ